MKERWLPVAEIAAHPGASPYTIHEWMERKQLPGHKAGRLWKFMPTGADQRVRGGNAAGDVQHD